MKNNESQSQSKSRRTAFSLMKKVLRFCVFTLLGLLVLLLLAWFGLDRYLKSNETKIFKELSFLNDGAIAFDEAHISLFKDFPHATLSLNNVVVQDAAFEQHGRPLVKVGNLSAAVSLHQLLEDHIIGVKSLYLQDGNIDMFTDSVGYGNLKAILKREKEKVATKDGTASGDGLQIELDGLDITLTNMDVRYSKHHKNLNIEGCIEAISTQVSIEQQGGITAAVDMDIALQEMVFSGKEGAYLEDSQVKGAFQMTIKDKIMIFEPFDLAINEEHFLFEGIVNTQGKRPSATLVLENQATRFLKIFPLLPPTMRKEIKIFDIDHPFYTKTTIDIFAKKGVKALADIAFIMEDNKVRIENYHYKKVDLEGRLVNRIYEEGEELSKAKNGISVSFENIDAIYKGFKLQTPHLLVTSTKAEGVFIYTKAKVSGKAARVSDFLQNDQFFFKRGSFVLLADIAAPLGTNIEMFLASQMRMTMRDFAVFYEPANVAFPFQELSLEKEAGDANFKIVGNTLSNENIYLADGGLENFAALVVDLVGEQAKSDVNFHAPKLGWTDFVDLFGENGYLIPDAEPIKKTEHQKKESMKEMLRGMHYNFQPSLSVAIDTLEYYDKIALNDFETGVHFVDANTLKLEKTSFKYGEGLVSLQATLDISQAERTPFEFELHAEKIDLETLLPSLNYFNIKLLSKLEKQPKNVSIYIKHKGMLDDEKGLLPNTSTGEIIFALDGGKTLAGTVSYQSSVPFDTEKKLKDPVVETHIQLEGVPRLFNNFFKTEQFFFKKGKFTAELDYRGDVADMNDLMNKARVNFSMSDSEIYYEPGDVSFPINQINLAVKEDDATFDLHLESDSLAQELTINGAVENLSELLLGNTGKAISTTADIHTPKLSWQEIQDFFVANSPTVVDSTDKTIKSTVIGVFRTFDPNIHLRIDTFIYSENLLVEELKTGLYLLDSNTLVLDRTGFKFDEGVVRVDGKFDLSLYESTPFESNVHIEDLNTGILLEKLNYLGLPSLKNIEKLSGQVNLDLDLAGRITKDGQSLVPEANQGTLVFELKNLQVEGFEPLDEMAAKFKMKKRFAALQFAPISNVFRIEGTEVMIPMMEIQSNAIHAYVEGQLSYGDSTNIWVSLPFKNLLFNDTSVLPEKVNYATYPMKVHVEVSSDEEGANDFKIRLSKRKFYENRGGKAAWRADKRAWRAWRKKD